MSNLLELFEDAKTFGSLIQVPPRLAEKLPSIEQRLRDVLRHGDLTHATAAVISSLLQQAQMLAHTYDLIVENPPYCGSRYLTPSLATFARSRFKAGSGDLFAVFVLRSLALVKPNGFMGVVCPFVWMFIATYEAFRRTLLADGTFNSMVRLEYNAFEPACVPVSAWVYSRHHVRCQTQFIDLSDFKGIEYQAPKTLEAINTPSVPYRYSADCTEFLRIPTAAFAYLVSPIFRRAFASGTKLGDLVEFTGSQNITGKNSKYVRLWWEVNSLSIGEDKRWVMYAKGGGNRKWWGLLEDVVDWSPNARAFYRENKTSNLLDQRYWYRPGITYSMLTSQQATFRILPAGAVYDKGGPAFHPNKASMCDLLLGLCNSSFADRVFDVLNPTLNLQVQDVKSLPVVDVDVNRVSQLVQECVTLSRHDWDSCETAKDFMSLPLFSSGTQSTIQESQDAADSLCLVHFDRIKTLEAENNRIFIDAFGLNDELSPEVADDQIGIHRPDSLEDIKRLLSYAIGCMMGRYSLDKPGLTYAHSGNQGFDPSQYKTFRADDDGIVPLLDADWGIRDDAANRIVDFIGVAWPKEHLEENLKFIAESLGPIKNEHSLDTIRRYLATGFYKDHLRWYRRRPIYWLFSSGKQRAFQCLVYLHRYHEGTLARMRTEYVIPLQGKIAARIEQLEGDKTKATSTSHGRKLQKEQDDLKKKQTELLAFDEKLKHAADKKISLDLDDGVKLNYGKFGDLLAEAKAVTGGKDDE